MLATADTITWSAAREREDGLYLDTHRAQIATALTIGDPRRRDRALAKIARCIRGRVWCQSCADGAELLARVLEDAVRYGGLDDVRLAVRGTTTKKGA